MAATNNLSILAATNTHSESHFSETKKSGLMGTGGVGFTVGQKMNSTDMDSTSKTLTGSVVGSLQGNTILTAGEKYNQVASTVNSPVGDVSIQAKSVDIVAGYNTEDTTITSIQKQSGFTVALSSPVTDALMSAKAVYDGSKDIGKSKNDRVNAMAVANTAWGAYQSNKTLGNAIDNPTGKGSGGISVSITYGQSEATQVSHDQAAISVGSTVHAGGKVNITATGAGENSNLNIVGSDVYGGTGLALKADNQINILSAEDVISNRSKNDSYSANAGVALTFDNGVSLGITAGGSYGKGKSNSDTINQHNSHVGSGGLTTLESGGTTTIAGGQVTGQRVEVDAQDLIIESKQDTNKANSQQFDASLQVTVGYGFSASGSLSASKAKADYASVNEQSRILAGDGGYKVNVKNNTNLIGGIITSSQAAEDAGKNSFSTGTLTSIDVQNHADYSATGFGVGGGFAKNGTGENTNQMTPQNKNSTAQGKASLTANKSVGLGHDSGHEASTTASGINTSNLTITNTAGQAATGKSADQIKAEVATGTTTDTVALNSGHIANNYDAQAVQDEINLQVKVTQEFDKTRQGIKAEINEKEKAARDAAEQETDPVKKNELEQNANRLQNQGLLLDIVAGGLAAPTNAVGGIVAGSLAPAVSYQIGQHFKDNGTEGSFSHLLAHTVLGAAVAAAGGNDALIAGLAAGGAEAAAPAVMHYLYGKDTQVQDLTADQKSTISAIVGLGGAAIGATGGAADVTQGSMAAVNAVENNYLTHVQINQWVNEMEACQKTKSDCSSIIKKYQALDIKQQEELISVCATNTTACESMYRQLLDDKKLFLQAVDNAMSKDLPLGYSLGVLLYNQREAEGVVGSTYFAQKMQEKYKLSPEVAEGIASGLLAAMTGITSSKGKGKPPVASAAGDKNALKYEGAPYHGTKNTPVKNKAPVNGQTTLEQSIQVKDTSPRRVAVDSQTGDFVVFDQTHNNTFHGHVRSWNELHPDMKSALIKANLVKPNGKIK